MVLGGGAGGGGGRPAGVGSGSALSFWGTMDGSTTFKNVTESIHCASR